MTGTGAGPRPSSPRCFDASLHKDLSEVALSRARQSGLIRAGRIASPDSLPEWAERSAAARGVTDARGDRGIAAWDPGHPSEPGQGASHEINEESREGCVEHTGREAKCLD